MLANDVMGSFVSILVYLRSVRFAVDSDRRADIAGGPVVLSRVDEPELISSQSVSGTCGIPNHCDWQRFCGHLSFRQIQVERSSARMW